MHPTVSDVLFNLLPRANAAGNALDCVCLCACVSVYLCVNQATNQITITVHSKPMGGQVSLPHVVRNKTFYEEN